ncbi:glycosyltransferase [Allopusillimonas ginsengisoli]|uniref:glycosyltransferase n=1 Tax=Allopusillimonas ginsengisoli TaxID=453575 RepID=UPI0039C1E413
MPILSVIIPTCNRQKYAYHSVVAILTMYKDVEVVVADNSQNATLRTLLSEFEADQRLIYSYTAEPISVVQNFEIGLSIAGGDYLIFIGDDDCIGPNCEMIAQWAKDNHVESVACTLPALYFWPDFHSRFFGNKYAGTLSIRDHAGLCNDIDTQVALASSLENFGGGVMAMPRAYLGMISRVLADRISLKYGSLFGGVSPDIYSAALICAESKKTVELDYPFVLPGSSSASTSGQSAEGKHKGGLRDNAHIAPFKDLVWDNLIPEFYSVPTVWSYSLKKAVDALDDARYLPNFPKLYAKCLLEHPGYSASTWKSISAYVKTQGLPLSIYLLSKAFALEALEKARHVIKRLRRPSRLAGQHTIVNQDTIHTALLSLEAYCEERNIHPHFPSPPNYSPDKDAPII